MHLHIDETLHTQVWFSLADGEASHESDDLDPTNLATNTAGLGGLQEYSKLVYMDADIFVLPTCPDIDSIFEYKAPAAAFDRGAGGFIGESRQCGLVRATIGPNL
mgnify:CR=1 FL=1